MAKGLTTREKKFVAALLADPNQNATSAAIKAGYSAKSAAQQASRLLRNAKIVEKKDEKVNTLTSKYDTSAAWVLEQLAKIASCDTRKFFNSDGSAKDITALDDESVASVAGFEAVELFDGSQGDQKHVTGLVKKFKLADRLRALELIGKHRAMFIDKSELSGPDGGAIPVSLEIDL